MYVYRIKKKSVNSENEETKNFQFWALQSFFLKRVGCALN